jgi:hypothetical protein
VKRELPKTRSTPTVLSRSHASRFTFHVSRVALCAWPAILCSAAPTIDDSQLPPAATETIIFSRDIKPILQENCYKCHAGERPRAKFSLTSRETALKGGRRGVDIIPGQSAKSPLIHFVARIDPDTEMPPEGKGTPLTAEQVGLLRAWIDQGVDWDQAGAEPDLSVSATLTLGYTTVSGSKEKFRELNWQREGWNRGLDEFELEKRDANSHVTTTGHILRDDYKIAFDATRNDLGFVRFGWSEYRKYYNSSGVVYPQLSSTPFDLNRDLYKDIGKSSIDIGLTLPNFPKLVFGYEQQWQEGSESTLQYGQVTTADGSETRKIYPAYRNISERTHIFKFNAEYENDGWLASDSFQGEWYNLSTTSWSVASYTNGSSGMATTVANEKESHFQGANTVHLEKQATDWWFASGGYLYSKYSGDTSVNVSNLGGVYLSAGDPTLVQWQTDPITLERESHVFSVASMLGPLEGLSLSFASQNEWTRQQGMGTAYGGYSSTNAPYFFSQFINDGRLTNDANLDRGIFSQTATLRFTKIPFTTLYGDARLQHEKQGQYEEELQGPTEFVRSTDVSSQLKDLKAGFNTSPWAHVSLNSYYRWSDSQTDYGTAVKLIESSRTNSYDGYPGFLRWRELIADEAQARLSVQPISWLKTSLSYKWLSEEFKARTDSAKYVSQTDGSTTNNGITPGGKLTDGRYDTHTVSLNLTLTPWNRLFLSTTFGLENARAVTFANSSDSVAPYRGNTWSALGSATYLLDEKTDLSASYSFSLARFSEDTSATSSLYDIDYTLHSLSVSLSHRFTQNLSGSIRYAYYLYDEPTSGSANNYEAHAVFASITYRWP